MVAYNRTFVLFLVQIACTTKSFAATALSFKQAYETQETFEALLDSHPKVDEFHSLLLTSLYTHYLAYCVLSTGRIERTRSSSLDMGASACNVAANLVSFPGISAGANLLGVGIGMQADRCADRSHRRHSRGFRDPTASSDIFKIFSRQLSLIFFSIIEKQSPTENKMFAEQVREKTLHYIKENPLSSTKGYENIAKELVIALLIPQKEKGRHWFFPPPFSLHKILYQTPFRIGDDERNVYIVAHYKRRKKTDADMYKRLPPEIASALLPLIQAPNQSKPFFLAYEIECFFGFNGEYYVPAEIDI